MENRELSIKYRPEIDGLRAIAVLPVILFHSGLKWFSGGYIGVDIFFVISGYLITSIIIEDINNKCFSLVDFYERRARRILPALYLVILLCLPLSWILLPPSELVDLSKNFIAIPLFISNILFWRTSGYFELATEFKPLIHTWSLAVEEQFYVVFPLLLIFLFKLKKFNVIIVIGFLTLFSFCCSEILIKNHPTFAFYMMPSRAWELLLGAFSAFYLHQNSNYQEKKVVNECMSLIGIALIIISMLKYNEYTKFPGINALLPTSGALLIIIYSQGTLIGGALKSKPLVFIGIISYSSYLWHQPLFSFIRNSSLFELNNSLRLGLTLLSLFFGYITWKFIETPFRNKLLIPTRKIFIWIIFLTLLFIIAGFSGVINKGFPQRVNQEIAYNGDLGQKEFYNYLYKNYYQCTQDKIVKSSLYFENIIRCFQSKSNNNVEVAIVGDSHAEHLFIGLADNYKTRNIAYYIRGSNAFIDDKEFKYIYDEILFSKSTEIVILSMYWRARLEALESSEWKKSLIKTLDALARTGKRVYIIGDSPVFSFSPERCQYAYKGSLNLDCKSSLRYILENQLGYSIELLNIINNYNNVKFINLNDYFCDNALYCSFIIGNSIMYRDNHHFNILGSKYVGEKIFRIINEENYHK